jgi:predicted nucleotidyltransferase
MKKKSKKVKPKKKVIKEHEKSIEIIGREKHDIAYKFAQGIFEKFPEVVKSIVLFGSLYKQKAGEESDIDIMIIIDDCSIDLTNTFVNWFNLEVANLIRTIDTRLHVNSLPLTVFWENVKAGEPLAINVLRYGVPLIDMGYFTPLQFLLRKGRIKPTYEAIQNCMTRAPWHIMRADSKVLGAIIDLHWTMIDAAQAALMDAGQVPPSKEEIPKMLMKTFVKQKKLGKAAVADFIDLYNTAKAIEHGKIDKMSGREFDRFRKIADNFKKKMKGLVNL